VSIISKIDKKLDKKNLKKKPLDVKFETTAKIVDIKDGRGNKRLKKKGILKTQKCSVKFKLWFDRDLRKGDIVHLSGVYLKRYRGKIELEITEGSIDYVIRDEERKNKNKNRINIYKKSDEHKDKKITDGGNPFNNFQGDIGPNRDNKSRWRRHV